jgi:hypothetical protein
MRVVSRVLATIISGRMVVRRRASIDVPAPGRSNRRTFWSKPRAICFHFARDDFVTFAWPFTPAKPGSSG